MIVVQKLTVLLKIYDNSKHTILSFLMFIFVIYSSSNKKELYHNISIIIFKATSSNLKDNDLKV